MVKVAASEVVKDVQGVVEVEADVVVDDVKVRYLVNLRKILSGRRARRAGSAGRA